LLVLELPYPFGGTRRNRFSDPEIFFKSIFLESNYPLRKILQRLQAFAAQGGRGLGGAETKKPTASRRCGGVKSI